MTNNPNDPQSYPGGNPPPMPGGDPAQGGYGAQPPAGYPGQPGGAMNPMAASAPLATWGKRAQGWLLDYLAPSAAIGLIASLMPGNTRTSGGIVFGPLGATVQLVLIVAWFGTLAYTSASTGQTWGRKWAKTQLLGENGAPIGFGATFGRYFAHILDSIACGIGWLFPLWDQQRQTFADKIVKTRVYDVGAAPMAQPPMGGQPG